MQVGRLLAGTSLIRLPLSMMSPEVGLSMPTNKRMSVVLPEPEGPTMVKSSPSSMSRLTPSTAFRVPKLLTMFLSCKMGVATAIAH